MTITLVRHAEVIEAYQGKYNGHINIPLSEHGKDQAKELAQKLSSHHFDKIYSSDLLRCRQTVDALNLHQEVILSEQLREKSWGRHEGKSFDKIQKEGIEYRSFEQWISALDGESIESYTKRIKNYFYETIFQSQAENILIVTHAGVIKTLFSITQNRSLEESFTLSLPYSSTVIYNLQNNSFTLK